MTRPSPRIEVAREALRQAILEQALKPGTRLPEDEIGAHFGMSRTLVRAVLARLQAEGLVDAQRKRTATVAQPSLAEAREVFEVRRALEAEVVRLVARRWEPSMAAELEQLVHEADEAGRRGDVPASARLAGEFHIRLARLSGNGLLERYMTELVTRCSLILAVYGRPHPADEAEHEHTDIIAALRAGDVERAVSIMDHHMEAVQARTMRSDGGDTASRLGDVLSRYVPSLAANVTRLPVKKARARP